MSEPAEYTDFENVEIRWRGKLVVSETLYRLMEESGWDMSGYVVGKPLSQEPKP